MAKSRRTFAPEFKAEAVGHVTEQGRGSVEAARNLDIAEYTAELQAGHRHRRGPGLPGAGQPARPRGEAAPPPRREHSARDRA